MTRPAIVPERETSASSPPSPVSAAMPTTSPGLDGDRLTPSPGAVGRSARISTLVDALDVPLAWLDRLLSLGYELPYEQGEPAVVRAFTAAVERLLPEVRVAVHPLPTGVVVTPVEAGTSGTLGTSGAAVPSLSASAPVAAERRAQWTEPPKSNERVRSVRVFPDAAYERSVTLPGAGIAALHFASDVDLLGSDASPHVQVMDRVALVAAQALARVQAEDRAAAIAAELRAAEAQMVQAEKLASLGQIAAGMVHELNNPLTSIAAYTDFLIRRAALRNSSADDDIERLRRIAESANRMLRFTRDLVSYARPSGDVPIAVGMNSVIERALAFCEHEIVGVGARVEKQLDDEIGAVRGLPEQLAQVFVNLVTNACHAMARPEDGSEPTYTRAPVITISTHRQVGGAAGCVTVIVQDSGCGITTENLGLIFNPFFTTKAAGRGTGLGLSIVKKIVLGHHGEIRAESDAAVGTRFILTFPTE